MQPNTKYEHDRHSRARIRDVGVIGCGFAGCATALFLARAGHRVTVYERAPEPSAIGAGILLQPSGLLILQRLGLLDRALERGSRIENLHCRTERGVTLFDLVYQRLSSDMFGLGMHRGALFELLFAELRRAGVALRTGVTAERIVSSRRHARLFAAGKHELAQHELIVVADGARSSLRERSPALERARRYPFGALWFIGTDPEQRFSGTLSQTCHGTQKMLGFLPSGFGPGRARVPLVSLFWSIATERVRTLRARGLNAWKAEVLRYEPRADTLLAQIEDMDQLLPATYVDAVMRRFHDPRVAYVGDAAHATSPQLGQGTNLALADAASLCDELSTHDDLDSALRAYSDARASTSRYYQWSSRWLTPLFQSNIGWLGLLRDRSFPWLVQVPELHREMLRTLAGQKCGFFTSRAALPEIARLNVAARSGSEGEGSVSPES